MGKKLVLLTIVFVSGCTWNDYIAPEGKSVAEVRQDVWQCEREAGLASNQFFFVQLQELQDHCMEARGYQAATN